MTTKQDNNYLLGGLEPQLIILGLVLACCLRVIPGDAQSAM